MKPHKHMFTDKGERHDMCLKCGKVKGTMFSDCIMSKKEWKKNKPHKVVNGKCVKCGLPEICFDGSLVMFKYRPYRSKNSWWKVFDYGNLEAETKRVRIPCPYTDEELLTKDIIE